MNQFEIFISAGVICSDIFEHMCQERTIHEHRALRRAYRQYVARIYVKSHASRYTDVKMIPRRDHRYEPCIRGESVGNHMENGAQGASHPLNNSHSSLEGSPPIDPPNFTATQNDTFTTFHHVLVLTARASLSLSVATVWHSCRDSLNHTRSAQWTSFCVSRLGQQNL